MARPADHLGFRGTGGSQDRGGPLPIVPPTRERHAHRRLSRHLWPDKTLYGCTLLVVTGAVGLLFALVASLGPVEYSENIPRWARVEDFGLSAFFSATALGLAVLALATRRLGPAFAGAVAGLVSIGPLGVSTLLSGIAAGFLFAARRELEHVNPRTLALSSDAWPDKTLAASLVLLVGSATSLTWGAALWTGGIVLDGLEPLLFAPLAWFAGLVGLVAAWLTYHQRGLWWAVAAASLFIATVEFFVVGPLLGLATLVLLRLANREGEFAPLHEQVHVPAGPGAPDVDESPR